MSEAVVIDNVSKRFGKPDSPRRLWHVRSGDKGNGSQPDMAGQNGDGRSLQVSRDLVLAVNCVSLTVQQGEIFGVLGPNGSGKSTLIRLIATLLLPDSGSILVFGYDVVKQSMDVQRMINRVSVEASFFKKLSPMENLVYGARLYGMDGRESRRRVVEILLRLGLEERTIHKPMEQMSRGMQQKVAIARALLSRPRLLLLDEPTTGLDPRSKREVQSVIRELNRDSGTTILLTTHDMAEADNLCDRIAIIDGGKIVALDNPQGLKRMIPQTEASRARGCVPGTDRNNWFMKRKIRNLSWI
jgi:ABC-2 type transport system ATP-binding protein